jgi:hypothetical protein
MHSAKPAWLVLPSADITIGTSASAAATQLEHVQRQPSAQYPSRLPQRYSSAWQCAHQ